MSNTMSVPLPSGMFWQILRKDWRLLKPLVIVNASLRALLGVVAHHSEPYPLSDEVSALAALVTLGLVITINLLIVLIVQQDALPGVNQDWLVRPIKRSDLLIAKLLGVALFVHGPIALVDLLECLSEGLPFGPAVGATLLGSLEIVLLFSLPVVALAALTRSIGEALLGALAIFVGLLLLRLVIPVMSLPFTHAYHFSGPVNGTGIEWIWRFVSHTVLLLGTVGALILQYFRRDTLRSRVVFVGGWVLFVLIPLLPWKSAFAIQQWFAASPGAGSAVSISFDPAARRSAGSNLGRSLLLPEDSKEKKSRSDKPATRVVVPLRVTGLPAGMLLHTDRVAVRLVLASGKTIYRGEGKLFDLPATGADAGAVSVWQTIEIPTSVYRKAEDRPLQVELDYSLTLSRSHARPLLAALNADRRLDDFGHCATRIESGDMAVEVGCRKAGVLPFCVSLALEEGGHRNPEKFVCELSYEPEALQFDVDPIDHLHAKLPFRDSKHAADYPVGEAELRAAQVVLSVYEPQDHFSRHIMLPGLPR